jgi:hypothetical protein
MITFVPLIKTVDLTKLDKPIKLTIDKKDATKDGPLWWKYVPFIPSIVMDPRTAVSVVSEEFDSPFMAYLFSQTFFTIYMYNKLDFDDPLKFYVETDSNSFYYFINQGEIIYIPLLLKNENLSVILTKFNDLPALKIQCKPQTNNGNSNKKRRRD